MKNALLALLGFILLSTPLAATAQQFGDFTYSSDGSAITITGYTGPGGSLDIPAAISGLPVTAIGNYAFYNRRLASVIIPNSVTDIGSYAFEYCYDLASVTTLSAVTNIGDFAFAYCIALSNVITLGSVTSIGSQAFNGCASLPAIIVDAGNSVYSSVDGVLFNKSQTTLIQYPGGKTGSYTIPNSVTIIWHYAFENCTRLTNITIPNSVIYIGYYAFSFCSSLQGVFFNGNPPDFGGSVFDSADNAVVYYLPGATGWETSGGPPPTRLWNPLMQSSGVGPAGFGFNITGAADIPIVIEASTSLANSSWVPLQSLNLTNGTFYFNDPDWTNYPARFYRIRSP